MGVLGGMYKVRILEGETKGLAGYVPPEYIKQIWRAVWNFASPLPYRSGHSTLSGAEANGIGDTGHGIRCDGPLFKPAL